MDEYESLDAVWLPLVMYFQRPQQSGRYLSTDSHGVRVSRSADGRPVSMDHLPRAPSNILVGNSTAFGFGATSDASTLASALAKYTGEDWLNLSCPAYTSTQELVLFQLHARDVMPVRRIVLFTGVVNLILHHRAPRYPKRYGSFLHRRRFERAMHDSAMGWNRRRLKALLEPLYGDAIDYGRMPLSGLPSRLLRLRRDPPPRPAWPGPGHDRTEDDVGDWLARDLWLWKCLADGIGAELWFVLQPLAHWTRKAPSPEESLLCTQFDTLPMVFCRTLSRDLTAEVYRPFSAGLATTCRQLGIRFFDMNVALSGPAFDGEWLFADRIHLTDAGYDTAAKLIRDWMDAAHSVRSMAVSA